MLKRKQSEKGAAKVFIVKKGRNIFRAHRKNRSFLWCLCSFKN